MGYILCSNMHRDDDVQIVVMHHVVIYRLHDHLANMIDIHATDSIMQHAT